ncbi:MAG TPA: L-threonylcarbamoyladenylate synthase [Bacillota bacterium]
MKVRLHSVRGVDREHPGYRRAIREGAEILKGGGLVAFPTETVYGLGALIAVPGAVERIFTAKGRPADNPLIVHVGGSADARRLCGAWPPAAQAAADAFWPGPLTLILPRGADVPDAVSAGLPTVAVRAPAHRVARDLIELAGPVAAPSANPSGRPSPTRAEHVLAELGDRVDLVIDDGPTPVGLESTVVDLTGPRPVLLRPGGVALDSLREVLGDVDTPTAAASPEGEGGSTVLAARSPGTRYRHYAPATPLVVVRLGRERDLQAATTGVRDEVRRQRRAGRRVAVLGADEVCRAVGAEADAAVMLGPYADPVQAARRLFEGLRRVDAAAVDRAVAHTYPALGVGLAVNDRLLRAATEIRDASPAASPQPPRRILMVCTGNTCRSPMAAALLRALAEAAGYEVDVRSAGVAAIEGSPPAREAVEVLATRGIALEGHRSRRLSADDVAWADVILTMTAHQRDQVRALYPEAGDRIQTLGRYAAGSESDIEDPIGGDAARYRATLAAIEGLLRRLLTRWRHGKGS